jgi:hypothetical protein
LNELDIKGDRLLFLRVIACSGVIGQAYRVRHNAHYNLGSTRAFSPKAAKFHPAFAF